MRQHYVGEGRRLPGFSDRLGQMIDLTLKYENHLSVNCHTLALTESEIDQVARTMEKCLAGP